MMMISTTRYILEVFGPYFAEKNNDISILNNLVKQTRSRLLQSISPEDLLTINRGFRDVIMIYLYRSMD